MIFGGMLILFFAVFFAVMWEFRTEPWPHIILAPLIYAAIPSAIVLSIVGVIISQCAFGHNGSTQYASVLEVRSYPIASLKTDTAFSGSFCFGTGSVGSFERYHFMFDLGDNTYARGWVPISAAIHETNDEKPKVSYDIVQYRNNKGSIWWPLCLRSTDIEREHYVLTVPKGTLVTQFKVE